MEEGIAWPYCDLKPKEEYLLHLDLKIKLVDTLEIVNAPFGLV